MSLNYAQSGVNIDAGNAFIENIKPIVQATHRNGVMGGLGGFGAAFKIPNYFKNPVIMSTTDGVGTKLRLAIDLGIHNTVGIDLVAMCVNDLITSGAEPLFFLDYFATGKLDVEQAQAVVMGISEGCQQANCALIGGETAEMPDMYQAGDYDLAGFCVGAVEQDAIVDATEVQPGQIIIGLASSGVHANGFSLVRKILEQQHDIDNINIAEQPLRQLLLQPTIIYVKAILELIQHVPVATIAHITGGGIIENLPRVLPSG